MSLNRMLISATIGLALLAAPAAAQLFTDQGMMSGSGLSILPTATTAPAAEMQAQATAFERGVPGSRVVRLTNATHWVWESNEADGLREMNAFIGGLRN